MAGLKVYDTAADVPSGMWQANCDLCQRVTWHYRPGKEIAHCTEHSNWHKGLRKRVVPAVVQSGGLNKTPMEPPTETQFRRMNSMDRYREAYRFAEKVTTQRNITDQGWARDLFDNTEQEQKNYDQVFCSICKHPTSHVAATKETKPKVRKNIEWYRDTVTGEVYKRESVHVIAETIYACPNCSLEIRKAIPVRVV